MQPVLDSRPDPVRYDIARRAAIDHDAALRLRCGERPIRPAQLLMKFHRFCLEPVSLGLTAPALGARQSNLRGHVENECQFGQRLPNGHAFQAADQPLIDISEGALIDAR